MDIGRNHGLVYDRGSLRNLCDNGASIDFHAGSDGHMHIPELFCVQRIYLHTPGDIFS